LRVHEDDAPKSVHDDHRIGRRLEEVAEFVLCLSTLSNVTDRTRDEDTLFCQEGAQADLDRKLGAVLSQTIELERRAHRANSRVRKEVCSMSRVLFSKPLRNEHLHPLANHLLASVS